MKTKNILLSILIIVLVIALIAIVTGFYKHTTDNYKNPVVKMEIADYGNVYIELYPDVAPNTVRNFIKLINEGFYNGLTFHRAVAGKLIQGGDEEGTGAGESDFAIHGEFYANDFKDNNLRHEAGTLSMARADYSSLSSSLIKKGYDSGSTQFFIMTDTIKSFDGLYAGFGKVISGLNIIEEISNLETATDEEGNDTENLANPPVITTMTVDTFGVDYGEPERVEPFDYYTWMLNQYSTYQTNGD